MKKRFYRVLTVGLIAAMIFTPSCFAAGPEGAAAKDISKATIENVMDQEFTGSAITPKIVVKDGNILLNAGKDYSVAFSDNTNVGTAKILVTGKGGYSGTLEGSFRIVPISIAKSTVKGVKDATYTGTAIVPEITVTLNGKKLSTEQYDVALYDNTNAGTATVEIIGKGNYGGTVKKTFDIAARKLSSSEVNIQSFAKVDYTGAAVTPDTVITDSLGGVKTLQNGVDYTISYRNNLNVGIASATITGKGNYKGTAFKTFEIVGVDLKTAQFADIPDQVYTGSAIVPELNIVAGGRTLVKDTDYFVTCVNNTRAGEATVTVTGKGGFKGIVTKKFKIVPMDVNSVTVSKLVDKVYTGSPVTQEIVLSLGNMELTEGKNKDYTVSYSENVNVGTATVTFTGNGNFQGTVTKTFKIKPLGTSITKVASQKKALKVTCKKQPAKMSESNISGYQLQYAMNSKFTRAKMANIKYTAKASTKTIKKLKANKKYFVRVRTYTTIDGKTYYSNWSKAKSATVK